jgi:hypothetical protein
MIDFDPNKIPDMIPDTPNMISDTTPGIISDIIPDIYPI